MGPVSGTVQKGFQPCVSQMVTLRVGAHWELGCMNQTKMRCLRHHRCQQGLVHQLMGCRVRSTPECAGVGSC